MESKCTAYAEEKKQTIIDRSRIIIESVMIGWTQISVEPVGKSIEFKDKA